MFDMIGVVGSAPGNFAQLASAYEAKHGMAKADLKRAMAHVSVKSHANGVKNPKAHLRKAIDIDTVIHAPMIVEPLGLYRSKERRVGRECVSTSRSRWSTNSKKKKQQTTK